MKRIEIDANLSISQINAAIQAEIDNINAENGTVVGYSENINNTTYCYNVTIIYTVII